jgi:hypothetical protein
MRRSHQHKSFDTAPNRGNGINPAAFEAKMREEIMNSLVAASALFLAGGLAIVTTGAAPLHGVLNDFFWAGLALSAFITTAGLEAAN